MRQFNKFHIMFEVESKYYKTFPNVRKTESVVLAYGLKSDEEGNLTFLFLCRDKIHGLIGFAVYYGIKKILRFYNHEGDDMGIETDMEFKPIKRGKTVQII